MVTGQFKECLETNMTRRRIVKAITELAEQPKLSQENNWLNPTGKPIRVRVGEIDQTNWAEEITDWKPGSRGTAFIRGTHFSTKGNGNQYYTSGLWEWNPRKIQYREHRQSGLVQLNQKRKAETCLSSYCKRPTGKEIKVGSSSFRLCSR